MRITRTIWSSLLCIGTVKSKLCTWTRSGSHQLIFRRGPSTRRRTIAVGFFAMLFVTAQALSAPVCTTSNTFVGTCQEYQDYAKACGPYLPGTGEHCGGMTGTGIAGCTVPLLSAEFTPYPKSRKFERLGKTWCVKEDYRNVISLLEIHTAVLLFVPGGDVTAPCKAEADAFNDDSIHHEAAHAELIRQTIAAMNTEYVRVSVTGCGDKRKQAEQQLETNAALRASDISADFDRRIGSEPADMS